MSQRDLLCFLAGASTALAIGAVLLWVVSSSNQPDGNGVQASLPSWHPSTEAAAISAAATDLHTLAEQARRQRNFSAAREAYAALERQSALTADEWADYADVVASLQDGALGGEPARLIDEALRADPSQPKGLWLKASLAHQQARYDEALVLWQRLREPLPADSPDRRIIAANIEEATRLMAGNGHSRPASLQAVPELDLRLGLAIR
jgi:hypothetical protein